MSFVITCDICKEEIQDKSWFTFYLDNKVESLSCDVCEGCSKTFSNTVCFVACNLGIWISQRWQERSQE